MPLYYYFLLTLLLSIIVILVHYFIQRRKNIPVELFFEALKNENNGHFEAAVTTYETALFEVKKSRFGSSNLKNRIIGKLKVLHTNIEYQNNFELKRTGNSAG
jgi:hypothetical protein